MSDWSSDVCSSDLRSCRAGRSLSSQRRGANGSYLWSAALTPSDQRLGHAVGHRRRRDAARLALGPDFGEPAGDLVDAALDLFTAPLPEIFERDVDDAAGVDDIVGGIDDAAIVDAPRSEEHTSELQSLMRISYAVFCL